MKKTLLFVMLLLGACSAEKISDSPDNTVANPTTAYTDNHIVTNTKASPGNLQNIYGIDISKYQGDIMTEINKLDSLSFVICKATEGATYSDPDFLSNWKAIKQIGLIRGAYHFYQTDDDPTKQAKIFLNAIDSLETSDIPPIIDIEQGSLSGNTNSEQIQKDLLVFLNYVAEHTGRKPMIYTGPAFANQYLNNSSFAIYPLWIAEYSGAAAPTLPVVWRAAGYTIWQKSQSYNLDSRSVDFDRFNGNGNAFYEFIATH